MDALCPNCGKLLKGSPMEEYICPVCKARLEFPDHFLTARLVGGPKGQPQSVQGGAYELDYGAENDRGGFLWGLLGFLLPPLGLILFLVRHKKKPRTAGASGKGALVAIILYAIAIVLYIVFLRDFLSCL